MPYMLIGMVTLPDGTEREFVHIPCVGENHALALRDRYRVYCEDKMPLEGLIRWEAVATNEDIVDVPWVRPGKRAGRDEDAVLDTKACRGA